MLACQNTGCKNCLVDARCESVEVVIGGTADDACMVGVTPVQAFEVPAVVGKHRPPGGDRVSKHLRIAAATAARFLDCQHIMAKQT